MVKYSNIILFCKEVSIMTKERKFMPSKLNKYALIYALKISIIIRVFYPKAGLPLQTRTKVTVLLGIHRCGSFPFSAPHSPFSIWKDPRGPNVEVRRVDSANWALRTSPKFTTGVEYQFHQGFWPDQRSGNPNHCSPLNTVRYIIICINSRVFH